MSLMTLPDVVRCYRTSRALQRYLDGEADDRTTGRIDEHLEECRRCGLNAATYRAIKQVLHAGGNDVDELALRRLRSFNRSLADIVGRPDPV